MILQIQDYFNAGMTDDEVIVKGFALLDKGAENTVIFTGRDYFIENAIRLPSNTTVIIDGCMIKQKDGAFDNVFRGDNYVLDPANPFGAPVSISEIENIRIIGRNGARIEGCDVNRRGWHSVLKETQDMTGDFWGWRTLQIALSKCRGFEIAGIAFTKTRCWAMSFDFCRDGYLHDLDIRSDVKNGDGVDFRRGCHHCRVENITGVTSDDTVACTALPMVPASEYPYRNYLYPLEPVKLPMDNTDPRAWSIHDIAIKNIHTGGHCHGIICLAAGGMQVYNIDIDGVHDGGEGSREACVKLYAGYGTGYNVGDLHDISIRNVVARISEYVVGCNTTVKNVVIENVAQHNPNGALFKIADWDGIEYRK